MWEHEETTPCGTDIMRAFAEAKPCKTAGVDGLVAEQWLAAMQAETRVAAIVAWGWNKRLAHVDAHAVSAHAMPPVRACHAQTFSVHASEA